MDLTGWLNWLKTWLDRHPLKGPSTLDRAQFTAEVMAKIKAQLQPVPTPAPPARRLLSPGRPVRAWLPWPRLAMTLATVATGVAVMIGVTTSSTRQLTKDIGRDFQLLATLGETDDQWVEETLQLLEVVDEDVSEETPADPFDDQWLEELEWLDETQRPAGS